nr:hypothetical protein OH820_18825 [Streptomyces sp. NBC_00857]
MLHPPLGLIPVPGCEVCAWWDKRRDNAARGIGAVNALHCARQIAAHPHRRAGDRRALLPNVAAPVTRPPQPSQPIKLVVGMAVWDPEREMPGVVHKLYGNLVCLIRPSGSTWNAQAIRVRPATDRERKQLQALAELQRKRGAGGRA